MTHKHVGYLHITDSWEYGIKLIETSSLDAYLQLVRDIGKGTHELYLASPPTDTVTLSKAKYDALVKDAERFKWLINPDNMAHVVWMKKPNKPIKFRIIIDGEPETGWMLSARQAIDQAKDE